MPPEAGPAAHHALAPHELVVLLGTDPQRGLAAAEAARRLERLGRNLLPAAASVGWPTRLLRQFHNPLIYVLLAAVAITAWLGEYADSVVIFAVVFINALVGFIQESRAEGALDALRSLVRTKARVVRDGVEQLVPSEDLVPGDLLLVEAGDKIAADARVVREAELSVDESALTGESVQVAKDEVVLSPQTPVVDRRNMLYSGTLVTGGTGAGVVVATGAGTEIGQIHRLVGTAPTLATPLTRKLARFSRLLAIVILALAAVTFGVGLLRGEGVVDMFTAAIALAVGAIPEGLPAAVTITLAIGVGRMAKRRAVIRRLPAVETLGSTTVVCSDKTGTLTENQMTVRAVWTPDAKFVVTGSGYAPYGEIQAVADGASVTNHAALRWSLLAGAGCNDATLTQEKDQWKPIGDPMEAALLSVAAKAGFTPAKVAEMLPRVDTIPFSSDRRYMATRHQERTGQHVVLVKGAAEQVIDLCSSMMGGDGSLRPVDRPAVLAAAQEYAASGLRVLATAIRPDAVSDEFDEHKLAGRLALTGLTAMLDPPRASAAAAVNTCLKAGISVKMVTGDHAATAAAIAAQLGLLDGRDEAQVLTGARLAELPADRYAAAVDQARVFARVSPEQKLRLVEALQDRDQIVAVTGDGVNDAPALRQANIGIAMGRAGTEVAKDAADMVLTDDDFATIEAAVEEGRGVFDNITKFIAWTLPTNVGEGLVILFAIVVGATLPLLPTQILWINMTTAVLLGLTLAFEPKEAGTMDRPPRDPGQPLLTGTLASRILLVSGLLVAGTWWLFELEQARGASITEARTAALNAFVLVQVFYLFNCRSLSRSAWSLGVLSNRWLVVGVSSQAAAQLAITYLPTMNSVFQTAPINAGVWLRILAIAAAASAVVTVDKMVRHRYARRQASRRARPDYRPT